TDQYPVNPAARQPGAARATRAKHAAHHARGHTTADVLDSGGEAQRGLCGHVGRSIGAAPDPARAVSRFAGLHTATHSEPVDESHLEASGQPAEDQWRIAMRGPD